jgi:hypothetical protein
VLIPYQNRIYHLKYPKGEVVRAPEGSLGIMTFDSLARAESFSWLCRSERAAAVKILKVRPLGKGVRIKKVSRLAPEYFKAFYKKRAKQKYDHRWVRTVDVPRGTICYKAVEVLD